MNNVVYAIVVGATLSKNGGTALQSRNGNANYIIRNSCGGNFDKTAQYHCPHFDPDLSLAYLVPLGRSCWWMALRSVLPERSSAAAPDAPAGRPRSFFLCPEPPASSASGSASPSAGGDDFPALFGCCCWGSCWSTRRVNTYQNIGHWVIQADLCSSKKCLALWWGKKGSISKFSVEIIYQEGSSAVRGLHNYTVTNLVPEFLDFIFSVFDSTLQGGFGSVMLILQVLQLLWSHITHKLGVWSDKESLWM